MALAYIGQVLGEQWDKNEALKTWFHRFDFVIGIIGLLAVVWWVWRHLSESRAHKANAREIAR
jgi:membrane protein DedA with SNARE-associated domain